MGLSVPIMGVLGVAFRGSGAAYDYAATIKADYGLDVIWPLVDVVSGVNVPEKATAAYDGTATGVTWQNFASPVASDTGLAPYFDGTNDFINLLTASLIADWATASDKFSIMVWMRPDGAFDTYRYLYHFDDGTPTRLQLFTANTPSLTGRHRYQTTVSLGAVTGWNLVVLTVDRAALELKLYLNNALADSQASSTSTFGALALAVLGAVSLVPGSAWKGNLAYFGIKFGAVLSLADAQGIYAAVSG